MKVRRIITLLILSVTSISLIIFTWLDLQSAYRRIRINAHIIGKADGPTSILVMDSNYNYVLYGITIVIIAVTLLLSLLYRRKRK
ncbi:MAG: hypothetical protein K0R46_978 [Herbinix sp.]|jgi:hypothetical protein|nr:hypothetical protein [Herbinix sp.]